MPTLPARRPLAASASLIAALAISTAPAAHAQTVLNATGVFGSPHDSFGAATVLELLDVGDTFSMNIPIHVFTETPGTHGGGIADAGASRGAGNTKMWYGQYHPNASITFDVAWTNESHTYGLVPHGLTFEVRDNVETDAGLRDELVIEFWPTPNSSERHEGSIFTFNIFASFDAGTWDGVDPVAAIDLSRAIDAGATLSDDEEFSVPLSSLSSFTVPSPGVGAMLAIGVMGLSRRRR